MVIVGLRRKPRFTRNRASGFTVKAVVYVPRLLAVTVKGWVYCNSLDARALICHVMCRSDMEQGQGKSGSGPLDTESAIALVTRTISDIESSDEKRRFILLDGFLCAAWPSQLAQSQ